MGAASSRSGFQRYGIAVSAVVVAFVASYRTGPFLNTAPWLFFFTAVIVTAWFGGWRESLVATAGLALLGRFFFMYPYRTLTLHRDNLVPMFGFIGLSVVIGHLAAARKRAEDHER